MRLCSLGSGSKGNATVVDSGDALVLVDAGFSCLALTRRLEARGINIRNVSAVVVTHEHIDHVRGIATLRKKHPHIDLHMTPGTAAAIGLRKGEFKPVDSCAPFQVDGMEIAPFPVPHDAAEPIQLTVRTNESVAGFLTDLGHVTPMAAQALTDCNVLVLECNYDPKMLRRNKRYPEDLKQRISGRYGHLQNGAAASLLESLARLHHVVAAHLSEENNLPGLALDSVSASVNTMLTGVTVASQEHGSGWIEL